MMMMVSVSDTLTITFTGDLLLDRGVRQRIEHRGVDHLFLSLRRPVFQSSDLVVANLECPATKIVQPNFKRFIFRAEPEWLQTLKAHGVTHLNLANNHSIDQGRAGLADTKKNIEQAGMIPCWGRREHAGGCTACIISLVAPKCLPVVLTTHAFGELLLSARQTVCQSGGVPIRFFYASRR